MNSNQLFIVNWKLVMKRPLFIILALSLLAAENEAYHRRLNPYENVPITSFKSDFSGFDWNYSWAMRAYMRHLFNTWKRIITVEIKSPKNLNYIEE